MVQHSPPTHQVPELSSLLHLSFCIMDIFVSVPSIIGGFVEGAAISNILFGITISQFYVYTQNWNRDPKWLKWLATGVMLLEVVYTVFSQRAQYYYSVLSVQDPVVILESDWSVPVCSLGTFAFMA
ncbi:hypothetical protein QCA50_013024 [Cerrena zonata]|uniref:Uncharacterized protein n=1 Tax=Cerrena zonata TaxID=2478898 RepID=A0AAW0FPN0_9APHY